MNNQETQLYRHFDAGGRLLYVGISLSAPHRLAQHMRGSVWAADIASIKVERYPTRHQALEAERLAILSERPLWNVTHSSRDNRNPSANPATKEERAFDAGNVPLGILAAAHRLRSLWAQAGRVWGDPPGALSVGVQFELESPCPAEKLDMTDMLGDACSPSPSSAFRVVTGVSAADPGSMVEGGYLSLLTPEGLAKCCEEFRGSNGQYDELYDSAVVPAISEYRKAFSDAPWDESLGWTPAAPEGYNNNRTA